MRPFVVSAVVLSAFAASSAFAVDLPRRNPPPAVKAPFAPPPLVAGFSWTGFYFGGHIGYGYAETDITDRTLLGTTQTIDSNGFLGGVQAGWNDQMDRFVLGVELDFSFADIKGDRTSTITATNASVSRSSNATWIATAATRFGYTWETLMVYAKLGTAWAQFDYDNNVSQAGVSTSSSTASDTRLGWVIGTGIEWAIAPAWSAKVEYNYIDLFESIGGGVSNNLDIDQRISVVKAGLNYRFSAPPGYGAPPYGYSAPRYGYGAPPNGYRAPPYGYGAPRY